MANAHGDHRPDGVHQHALAPMLEELVQAAGGRGENDIVDRAAQALLDPLEIIERDRDDVKTARLPDRHVEAGVRRPISSSRMTTSAIARVRERTEASLSGCSASSSPERAPPSPARAVSRMAPSRPSLMPSEGRSPFPFPNPLEPLVRGSRSSRGLRAPAAGSASQSSSAVATQEPLTPSTRQWCTLVAMAQPPSSSPSTSVISQRARARSKRRE